MGLSGHHGHKQNAFGNVGLHERKDSNWQLLMVTPF
jgi:hypothetical protein